MSLPVATGSGLGRFSRSSDEYVQDIVSAKQRLGNRKLSAREKQAAGTYPEHRQNGMIRLGQSMIGPIQLQLRYQGILRNVLLEDTLTPVSPFSTMCLTIWVRHICMATKAKLRLRL